MELNKIQSSGSWGKAADDLNQNFSKVNNAVEQVKNATTRNKGYFSTDAALKSAFKSASLGDIAYIGRAYPYQTWEWDGSEWTKKNDNGGDESVNLGDYYTKEETDKKLSDTSEEISGLRTETDQKLSETSEEISGLRTETDQKLSELGSETEKKLSELESEVKVLQDGEFSFDTSNYISGYSISDAGVLSENPNYGVSDFIDIAEAKNAIIVYRETSAVGYVVVYNESKIAIDYYSITKTREIAMSELNSLGARYIRIDFLLSASGQPRVLDLSNGLNLWAKQMGENISVNINDLMKSVNDKTPLSNFEKLQNNVANIATKVDKLGCGEFERNFNNYTSGCRVNTSGDLYENTIYGATEFIDVADASDVTIYRNTTNAGYVAIYDHNKNFLDYYSIGETRRIDISSTANSRYIRFDFLLDATETPKVLNMANGINVWVREEGGDKKVNVFDLGEAFKEKADKRVADTLFNYIPNASIDSKGEIYDNRGYGVTEFVNVRDYESVYCRCVKWNGGAIALYDENKNFIDYYSQGADIRAIDVADAAYIRMSFFAEETLSAEVYDYTTLVNLWSPIRSIKAISESIRDVYTYEGQPIILKNKMTWRVVAKASYIGRVQDACCHNNTLFQFYTQDGVGKLSGCEVFDLVSGDLLQQIPLEIEEDNHNNSVVFGDSKYEESDEFPLLYTSTMSNINPRIYVYRILGNKGNYTLSKVQTIYLSAKANYYSPTCFIDHDKLVVYWCTKEAGVIEIYTLPSVSVGTSATLSSEIDNFNVSRENPYGVEAPEPEQGGEVYDGKLYMSMGFEDRCWLNVISLAEKKVVSTINFADKGLNEEPEGACVWGHYLVIPFNGTGRIVAIDFVI